MQEFQISWLGLLGLAVLACLCTAATVQLRIHKGFDSVVARIFKARLLGSLQGIKDWHHRKSGALGKTFKYKRFVIVSYIQIELKKCARLS